MRARIEAGPDARPALAWARFADALPLTSLATAARAACASTSRRAWLKSAGRSNVAYCRFQLQLIIRR